MHEVTLDLTSEESEQRALWLRKNLSPRPGLRWQMHMDGWSSAFVRTHRYTFAFPLDTDYWAFCLAWCYNDPPITA
jgi:hypothetical protein